MKDQKNRKEKNKFIKSAGIIIGILILIVIILALLHGCEDDNTDPADTAGSGIIYDDDAISGGWVDADHDKIIENLNQKVEEGMINISMNTSPIFTNGTSKGNLMIVNESINRYPQVIEINRNDTGELIYKSNAIPVGSKIESAILTVDLPKGTYECTAMFYNVDPTTGAYLGCAGAIVNITILN